MLEVTIYRSRCTGPAHGWKTVKLARTSFNVDVRSGGGEIGLHVHSAHEARALAAALIEAAEITDAHLTWKEGAPC